MRTTLMVNRPLWRWIPTGLFVAVFVALAVFTRAFTAFPSTYYMTGASMEPSVRRGAWFLASPPGGATILKHGQLVLMEHWIDDTLYHVLRRVVGLAGDTLRMVDGVLRVSARTADWPARIIARRAERTLDGPVTGTIYNWGPVAVGPDSVFLLSDTRDMLGWPDSRFLGPVHRDRIVARYLFRLW